MKKLFTAFALLLFMLAAMNGAAQSRINKALQQELDSIFTSDQYYRKLLGYGMEPAQADSLAKAWNVPRASLINYMWEQQHRTDSINLARVQAIFQQYGYPGKSLVDSPANEAAWLVIQHSTDSIIRRYFPLIRDAGNRQELPFQLVAMMEDRLLVNEGKEQLYGTQGFTINRKDSATGKINNIGFIWPIKDPQHVNERRKQAGFPDTVEENALRMGIEYKVISLEQAARWKKGLP